MWSLLAASIAVAAAQDCTAPPPASDFNFSSFDGAWYEIARIQTAGGAALQDFCACTELIYSPTPSGNYGDLTTLNSCRFLSPSGFFLNATSYLANMTVAAPGHWLERYCPECPAASYNIILDGVDERGVPYAVEYDCSNNAIFGNNCEWRRRVCAPQNPSGLTLRTHTTSPMQYNNCLFRLPALSLSRALGLQHYPAEPASVHYHAGDEAQPRGPRTEPHAAAGLLVKRSERSQVGA
jgi:hypothetical protein